MEEKDDDLRTPGRRHLIALAAGEPCREPVEHFRESWGPPRETRENTGIGPITIYDTLVSSEGMIDYRSSPPRENGLPVGEGDTAVFATGGIKGSFSRDPRVFEDRPHPCNGPAPHRRRAASSLVLAVRCLGVSS